MIDFNNSQDDIQISLVTGMVLAGNIIINPTLDELHKYGATYIKKDPERIVTIKDSGEKLLKIDVWMKIIPENFKKEDREKAKNLIINLPFFLSSKVCKSSDETKTQFINKYGKCTYAESVDAIDGEKFDKTDIRPAYRGEAALTAFIKNWANFPKEAPAQLDIAKLLKQNFKELKVAEKALAKRKIKVLVGLREYNGNHSMQVYGKETWRSYSNSFFLDGANVAMSEVSLRKYLDSPYHEFTGIDKVSFIPKFWEAADLAADAPDDEDFGNTDDDTFGDDFTNTDDNDDMPFSDDTNTDDYFSEN